MAKKRAPRKPRTIDENIDKLVSGLSRAHRSIDTSELLADIIDQLGDRKALAQRVVQALDAQGTTAQSQAIQMVLRLIERETERGAARPPVASMSDAELSAYVKQALQAQSTDGQEESPARPGGV